VVEEIYISYMSLYVVFAIQHTVVALSWVTHRDCI